MSRNLEQVFATLAGDAGVARWFRGDRVFQAVEAAPDRRPLSEKMLDPGGWERMASQRHRRAGADLLAALVRGDVVAGIEPKRGAMIELPPASWRTGGGLTASPDFAFVDVTQVGATDPTRYPLRLRSGSPSGPRKRGRPPGSTSANTRALQFAVDAGAENLESALKVLRAAGLVEGRVADGLIKLRAAPATPYLEPCRTDSAKRVLRRLRGQARKLRDAYPIYSIFVRLCGLPAPTAP